MKPKQALLLAVTMAVCAFAPMARAHKDADKDAAIRKELQAELTKLAQAIKRKDVAGLMAFTLPDYVSKAPHGKIIRRPQTEARLRNTFDHLTVIHDARLILKHLRPRPSGMEVLADLDIQATGKMEAGGAPAPMYFSYTAGLVWVKEKSGWKIREGDLFLFPFRGGRRGWN